jgi:hypothetical protein
VGLIIVAPQFVCQLAPSGPGADLSSSHLIIFSIERLLGGKKVLRVPRRYDTHPLIPCGRSQKPSLPRSRW